jgi:hypothetical protein
MEDLEGGFLDGPVHPLGLAIGPGMVWFGQLVLDPVLIADAIEDVGAEITPGGSIPVFGKSAKAMPLSVSTMWIA